MSEPENRLNELVTRAVGGDLAAVKLLLIESEAMIRRRIERRVPAALRPAVGVEDIVQETHVEVFRRIGGFEVRDNRAFERWISTVALSRLRNALRAQRAARRGGGRLAAPVWRPDVDATTVALLGQIAGPNPTPSRCMARKEAVAALRAGLERLPEQYRQALWLVHIEQLPVRQAALALGKTERAIHGLCRRGLMHLRDELGDTSRFFSKA